MIFPEVTETPYEALIEGLSLPDLDDRHVLAAAIRCQTQLIVSGNLRDCPAEVLSAYEIGAHHPDHFLSEMIELYPSEVASTALGQWRSLRNPPKMRDEFLGSLERQGLIRTAVLLKILLPQEK